MSVINTIFEVMVKNLGLSELLIQEAFYEIPEERLEAYVGEECYVDKEEARKAFNVAPSDSPIQKSSFKKWLEFCDDPEEVMIAVLSAPNIKFEKFAIRRIFELYKLQLVLDPC